MYPMHTVNFVFAGLDIWVRVKSGFSLYKLTGRFYLSQTHTTEILKTYNVNAL